VRTRLVRTIYQKGNKIMKKILALAVLATLSTASFANDYDRHNKQNGTKVDVDNEVSSVAVQSQETDSAAFNAGNSQSITFTSPEKQQSVVEYKGDYTVKNVPSMNGPALVSSNDTCMGSASGALSGPGFGLALGKTYTDDNCVMLKNSRELWNMGMKAASLALMCNDAANKAALEVTGYTCPTAKKD
jgi:hypothetical protein